MVYSNSWELKELEDANTIFQPDDRPEGLQLLELLVWVLECAVAYGLARLVTRALAGA